MVSAARCTLREMSLVAAPCPSTAEAMVEEISDIRPSDEWSEPIWNIVGIQRIGPIHGNVRRGDASTARKHCDRTAMATPNELEPLCATPSSAFV
jgi:hypothetical protein